MAGLREPARSAVFFGISLLPDAGGLPLGIAAPAYAALERSG